MDAPQQLQHSLNQNTELSHSTLSLDGQHQQVQDTVNQNTELSDGHQQVQDTVNQNTEPDKKTTQPVRSRWTPKPEQIMILESIFNSGTVNPAKEETVRIRKLLEKFGPVGDANVFYWFQNRRSRSRRKQRLIQASLEQHSNTMTGGSGPDSMTYVPGGSGPDSMTYVPMSAGSSCVIGGSGSCLSGGNVGFTDEFFGISGQIGHQTVQDPVFVSSDVSGFQYQPGLITVFINGIATEVGSGPLDMKAMFGEDFVLVHSSGVTVQVNEYGFLVQGLQHGEAYFLVPRNS